MGDTGGACRLDGILHPSCHLHLKKNMERKETRTPRLPDISVKIKMERKEIRSTFLHVLRYILKRKDGMKSNPQNHLAGDDVD